MAGESSIWETRATTLQIVADRAGVSLWCVVGLIRYAVDNGFVA